MGWGGDLPVAVTRPGGRVSMGCILRSAEGCKVAADLRAAERNAAIPRARRSCSTSGAGIQEIRRRSLLVRGWSALS
jgi:hypothetical protein